MIVLDTNVISEIFRPQPDSRVLSWLENLTGDVAITAITLAELMAGLKRLPEGRRRSDLITRVEEALAPYRETQAILPFDFAAAEAYADILAERDVVGLPIHTADAQIAAICRVHQATCATRNSKDFVHTGVDIIDPWSL